MRLSRATRKSGPASRIRGCATSSGVSVLTRDAVNGPVPHDSAPRLLRRVQAAGGQLLSVYEDASRRWLSIDGEFVQSLMHMASPDELMLPQQQAMMLALLWRPRPRRILNLGLGGGGFERFFYSRFPGAVCQSVELLPELVTVVEQFFQPPANLTVMIQDAEQFLAQSEEQFDLVLADLFCEQTHPDCLYDTYFYRDAARAIGRSGVFSINLAPLDEDDRRALLSALRQAFNHVAAIVVEGFDNLVCIATQRPPPDVPQLTARAARGAARWGLDLAPLLSALQQLPARRAVFGY